MKDRASGPGLRPIAKTLWSLWAPAHFPSARPARPAQRYRACTKRRHPLTRRPLADIYRPEKPGPLPSVVLVHGGAFFFGSRSMKPVRFLTHRLLPAGLIVCAIDYRMIFHGGRWPEAVEDVCSAIRWWKENAALYGGDPDAISLIGISAGASLCYEAAKHVEPNTLQRLTSIYGVYDFPCLGGPLSRLIPTLLHRTTDSTVWSQHSPLRGKHPALPTLIVHGTKDGLVPISQALSLCEQREQADLPTRSLILDNEPHSFLNWPGPAAEQTVAQILDFLQEKP